MCSVTKMCSVKQKKNKNPPLKCAVSPKYAVCKKTPLKCAVSPKYAVCNKKHHLNVQCHQNMQCVTKKKNHHLNVQCHQNMQCGTKSTTKMCSVTKICSVEQKPPLKCAVSPKYAVWNKKHHQNVQRVFAMPSAGKILRDLSQFLERSSKIF